MVCQVVRSSIATAAFDMRVGRQVAMSSKSRVCRAPGRGPGHPLSADPPTATAVDPPDRGLDHQLGRGRSKIKSSMSGRSRPGHSGASRGEVGTKLRLEEVFSGSLFFTELRRGACVATGAGVYRLLVFRSPARAVCHGVGHRPSAYVSPGQQQEGTGAVGRQR
jgi:hypothetical protein